MALLVNVAVRITIFFFLGEVLLFPDDPRFAGKAIPIRNLIIVVTLSLLFPIVFFLKKKWNRGPQFASKLGYQKRYPFWLDNLYLSIFWLDMAGNSFNLYDTYFYFDLIPHFHGTGAIAGVLFGAFGLNFIASIGLANIIHMLLEAQEFYTDVLAKTHNVRGTFDTVNDLVVGLAGTIVYCLILLILAKRKG